MRSTAPRRGHRSRAHHGTSGPRPAISGSGERTGQRSAGQGLGPHAPWLCPVNRGHRFESDRRLETSPIPSIRSEVGVPMP
jgi:hypothetical protein